MGMTLNQILNRFVWNGLGLAVLVAPLAIGAVHWPVQLTLAALAGALLLAYALLSFRRGQRVRVDGFVLVGLLAGAAMLFQLLPLGDGLLASLSPRAFGALEKVRELGYDVAGRISVAPAGTVHMLCLLATALCLYIVAFNLTYREGTGNKLLGLVGIAGAVVAVIAFAHYVTKTDLLLGFYAPEQGIPPDQLFVSTFVNNNNAAGFLNLSLFILAGQWQKAQFGKAKGIYAVLVLVTTAGSLAMLSRGGLVALLLGGAFMAVMTRWGGGYRRGASSHVVTLIGVLLTVAAVAVFLLLFNKVLGQVENSKLFPFGEAETKVKIWERTRLAVDAYRHSGAGAGAFHAAFSPFNDLVSRATILHAENELLEPLVEFGLPLGLALLALPLVLLWRRFSFARTDGYYAGAMAGLFALGIQQVADFGLRIPGVLLPATVVLGTLSGAWARERVKNRRWLLRLGGLKLLPLAAALYLLLIVGFAWVRDHDTERVHAMLAAQMEGAVAGPVEFETNLGRRLVEHHQHDSQLFTLLGRRRVLRGELDEAQAHYRYAEELCPKCVAPRIGMARLSQLRGDAAGLLTHLLSVARMAPNRMSEVFEAVVAARVDAPFLVAQWQEDPELIREYVHHLYARRNFSEAERVIRATIDALGRDVRMLNYLGKLYLAVKETRRADEVATWLMGMYPDSKHGFVIQARVYIQGGDLDSALLMYEEALSRTGEETDVELSLEVMGLLARMRHWDRFEAISSELRLAIGENRNHRASFHVLLAVREEMRGEYFAALQELDQAESSTPYDIRVPLRKARLQLLLGRADKAVAEYRKALKISPNSAEAAEGLKDLEVTKAAESPLQ